MESALRLPTAAIAVTDPDEALAMGALFEATSASVFRAVLLVTRDRVAAEDAVSGAYLKAIERWDLVSRHPKPVAWLVRVALNDSISTWRRARM